MLGCQPRCTDHEVCCGPAQRLGLRSMPGQFYIWANIAMKIKHWWWDD